MQWLAIHLFVKIFCARFRLKAPKHWQILIKIEDELVDVLIDIHISIKKIKIKTKKVLRWPFWDWIFPTRNNRFHNCHFDYPIIILLTVSNFSREKSFYIKQFFIKTIFAFWNDILNIWRLALKMSTFLNRLNCCSAVSSPNYLITAD